MQLFHRLRSAVAVGFIAVALQAQSNPDPKTLTEQGYAALAQNRLPAAAQLFQAAIDLNPSSARAHEGLGLALGRMLSSGNVRPAAESDVLQRTLDHLRRATELAPSAVPPRLALSEVEAGLAQRSDNPADRTEHYRQAREMLKQAVALKPGQPDLYIRLANLARDEFGPSIQQAASRSNANKGPIQDLQFRRTLQQQYGDLVNEAIENARTAAQLSTNSPQTLLLLSRLFRERALIRDTPDQYSADILSAEDAQRQFLAMGGHLDGR